MKSSGRFTTHYIRKTIYSYRVEEDVVYVTWQGITTEEPTYKLQTVQRFFKDDIWIEIPCFKDYYSKVS